MGNLGDTIGFDLPPRMTVTNSLVANFQPADQRIQVLTCGNAASASYAFTSQQFIFNVEDYMERFGKSAITELGAQIEANIATNTVTNTFRFFGDGVNPINSFNQLAQALAFFRNFGSASGRAKGYLSDIAVPNIVGSGLNQFVIDRNNKMAMSWEVGEFSNCDWYQSNLLPVHIAGTEGQVGTVLTVAALTFAADGSITAITFNGTSAAGDANSVKQYDKFQFIDGVAGQPNMRYLTFVGHQPSSCPVQFQATANAASTGGSQVTVNVYPPLQANPTNYQNLNNQVQVGMQVRVLPSHRSGMITAGEPLFVGMPMLPDQTPFPTANANDSETGVSLRMYYGATFGQNQMGTVYDCIWGSTLVPEYSMALIFPL